MLMYWEKLKTFPKEKHLSCVLSFTHDFLSVHIWSEPLIERLGQPWYQMVRFK